MTESNDSWDVRLGPSRAKATLSPPTPSDYRVPQDQVAETFGYWRWRLLLSTYAGYAMFYLIRTNLPLAVPAMQKDLGLNKETFGIFFTLHGLTYGIAKFLAGLAADRYNPRVLLSVAMMMSVLCNVLFGFGGAVGLLGTIWVANGFFQGFGFPPCARVLSYWFAPRERGLYWGIFNTSHQLGAMLISVLAGFMVVKFGWQYAFWTPAAICVAGSLMLWNRVRDTPASLGLPSVETYHLLREGHEPREEDQPGPIGIPSEGPQPIGSQPAEEPQESVVRRLVWRNPAMWLVCIGNFFVYVVRASFQNWAPTYMVEVKGFHLTMATGMNFAYELGGLFGCLLAGWVTDRFLQGRRAPACVLWMVMCSLFIFLFWSVQSDNPMVYGILLVGVGFWVYGPQFLVGVMVADLATKKAAGTAVGLSGLFGYLSQLISGAVLGILAQRYGWNASFSVILGSSMLACIPFALTWNAKAPDDNP